MRRIALLAAAAGVALLAGCGGGGDDFGRPPREYASSVCTAIDSWLEQVKDRSARLQEESQRIEGDLEQGKSLIVGYLDDAISYSDQLVEEVEAADKPDLDHGEAIAGEVRTAVERARTAFVDAREEADSLSTDDPEAFRRQAREIGQTLGRQGDAIEEALEGVSDRYGANELDQAFSNEDACRDLG